MLSGLTETPTNEGLTLDGSGEPAFARFILTIQTAESRRAFWASRHRCGLVTLRPRMSIRIGFFQAFHRDVGVDLRRGQAGVPQ
jgi:hypothetical protein